MNNGELEDVRVKEAQLSKVTRMLTVNILDPGHYQQNLVMKEAQLCDR